MAAPTPSEPLALILIADGTEEIEFVTAYDVLVRAGYTVLSIGVGSLGSEDKRSIMCSRGVKIIPDVKDIASLEQSTIDAARVLILPGGAPGAKTFCNDEGTLDLVRHFRRTQRHVALICAATTVLVVATATATGTGTDTAKCKVTSHPSVKDEIVEKGWEYVETDVVVDGKVITSRGPGTAMEFALTVVEETLGKEKREQLQAPMMFRS